MQKMVSLNTSCDAACLTVQLLHVSTGSSQSHQCHQCARHEIGLGVTKRSKSVVSCRNAKLEHARTLRGLVFSTVQVACCEQAFRLKVCSRHVFRTERSRPATSRPSYTTRVSVMT